MEKLEGVLAEARQFLELQLAAARKAHSSVARSTAKIIDELESFGMDKGFVPVEKLVVGRGFKGAKVVIAFCDYITEATIRV